MQASFDPALASQRHRIKGRPPAPMLLFPGEELVLDKIKEVEFRWRPQGYTGYYGFYDFRLYEGTELVEKNLIFKEKVPGTQNSIRINSEIFKAGQIYAWSVRQVTAYDKGRSSYSIFRVLV